MCGIGFKVGDVVLGNMQFEIWCLEQKYAVRGGYEVCMCGNVRFVVCGLRV